MTIKKIYYTSLFLIIPSVYLFIGVYFNQTIGLSSLRNIDPEYAYFISGLNIANGHFVLGHIDHPGTPLQYVIALTFRFAYFLSPHDHSFNEDVFLNSDYYMNVVNYIVIAIILACLFFIGKKVYKTTQNIAYGLLIQTAPFYSEITYDIIGRIVPELILPIPIILFSAFFLKLIYAEDDDLGIKDTLIMSIIAGFGLSIKLTFITFWIIPIFILPGFRKKIIFVFLSIVSFLLIALPVTLKINSFYVWVKNLLIHSGDYGQGDSSFVNWDTFASNIETIIKGTPNLLYALILLIFILCVFFFRKKTNSDNRLFQISLGIIIAIVLQILLVSKHYSFRYLIPSLAFIPMLLILLFDIASRIYTGQWNKKIILLIVLAGFVPGVNKQKASAQLRSLAIRNEMGAKRETWFRTQVWEKDSYKIIVSQGYGAPLQDYAIAYSMCWAGPHYQDYTETLSKLYPNTYQYFTWDNTIKYFGSVFNPEKIMESRKPVYLYLENDTPELIQKTMDQMFQSKDSVAVTSNRLFRNEKTNEGLYILQLSSTRRHPVIP